MSAISCYLPRAKKHSRYPSQSIRKISCYPPNVAPFEELRFPDRRWTAVRAHAGMYCHRHGRGSSYVHSARRVVRHKHRRELGCRGCALVVVRITKRLRVTKRGTATCYLSVYLIQDRVRKGVARSHPRLRSMVDVENRQVRKLIQRDFNTLSSGSALLPTDMFTRSFGWSEQCIIRMYCSTVEKSSRQ